MGGSILTALTWPFRWLFYVPPVEKRPHLTGLLRSFSYGFYNRRDTDSYLFLKVYLLNLVLNIFFTALFWLSYLWERDIDLGFIHVLYNASAPIDTFLFLYPHLIFPPLIAVTLFYTMALLILKSDMLSPRRGPPEDEEMRAYLAQPDFHLSIFRYVVVSAVLACLLPSMEWIPDYFRRSFILNSLFDFRGHSPQTFAFYTALYLFFYQGLIVNGVAFCFVGAIRNSLTRYVYREKKVTNPSKEGNES